MSRKLDEEISDTIQNEDREAKKLKIEAESIEGDELEEEISNEDAENESGLKNEENCGIREFVNPEIKRFDGYLKKRFSSNKKLILTLYQNVNLGSENNYNQNKSFIET